MTTINPTRERFLPKQLALTQHVLCAIVLICTAISDLKAQSLEAGFAADFSVSSIGSVASTGGVLGFAPGVDDTLYVGTLVNGILAFDYDPVAGISNGRRAVPQDASSANGSDGALGLTFHQDQTYGLVMYYAPNTSGADPFTELQLRRANDSNGNGVFGDAGDSLNQVIVNNLRARGEGAHRLNNMQVYGDSLYLNIGSRTQNGGIDTDARFEPGQARGGLQAGGGYSSGGITSAYGEYAYTGAINFIEDLNSISNGENAAGFSISSTEQAHALDTQSFTSNDPGKLRVYSTGFRNVYGLAINDQGELFVSENQNEWPTINVPDRVLKVDDFQDDFGYQKSNGFIDSFRTKPDFNLVASPLAGITGANGTPYYSTLGTYRDPNGSAAALAAANAGFFQQTASLDTSGDGQIDLSEQQAVAFALVPPQGSLNPAVTGMSFMPITEARPELAGDLVVGKFVQNSLSIIDKQTGAVEDFLTGFANPIDVASDPFGNLLSLSTNGQLIRISPDDLVLPSQSVAHWSMDSAGPGGAPGGNPAVLDSSIAFGQGLLVGVNNNLDPSTNAEDHLWTFNSRQQVGGANNEYVTSVQTAPLAMFAEGFDGGSASYDAGSVSGVDGALFFPADVYGSELNFAESFSIEMFFQTEGDQSNSGPMQLIMQGESNFRYGLSLNEGDPGNLRFEIEDMLGAPTQVNTSDATVRNFADGEWHYLLATYNAVAGSNGELSLTILSEDGSIDTTSLEIDGNFTGFPGGGDGNLLIGRNTFSQSADPRTFLGLIDEIRISAGVVHPTAAIGAIAPVIPGDYNRDGVVDTADYDVWSMDFGSSSSLAADGNDNGVVDAADYTVWRDAIAGAAGVIPEPISALIALLGIASLVYYRH